MDLYSLDKQHRPFSEYPVDEAKEKFFAFEVIVEFHTSFVMTTKLAKIR